VQQPQQFTSTSRRDAHRMTYTYIYKDTTAALNSYRCA
jgi:hypothetical protein